MLLSSAGKQTPVTFPTSAISRIQLAAKAEEPDENTPTLSLANEDQLVGVLTGKLKLETAFDTLNVDAAQVKTLRHSKGSVQDVQVTLWDDTTVSGQLAEPELNCTLRCGVAMRVPVALIEEYQQPAPQPSDAMIGKVKDLVAQLNADDWKARDRAETQLVGLGPVVAITLKQMRPAQNPEAQQRIDSVLKQLEKVDPKPTPPASGPAAETPAAGGAAAPAAAPANPPAAVDGGPVPNTVGPIERR
jgi:hypothetical protein